MLIYANINQRTNYGIGNKYWYTQLRLL